MRTCWRLTVLRTPHLQLIVVWIQADGKSHYSKDDEPDVATKKSKKRTGNQPQPDGEESEQLAHWQDKLTAKGRWFIMVLSPGLS